jgi:adenylate cyclase
VSQGVTDRGDPAVAEMIALARTALSLDANNPEVLLAAAQITALPAGDPTGGLALIDKAIGLNPNDASGMAAAAYLHAYAGDTGKALAYLERADRLNPLNRTAFFYFVHALAHFVAGEHEAVVEWTAKALQERPKYAAALRYRVASFGLLGRLEEGRQALQRLLELAPDFTIGRARRHIEYNMNSILKSPGVADSLYEGLRRCGLSE